MQQFRLAYSSVVAGRLTKADLKQILSVSVLNNQTVGLTGALCFSRGAFIQILEGDRFPLNKTFQRISHDPRHKEIYLIGLGPVPSRAFGNWAMAFIDDDKNTQAIILKHCGVDKLTVDYMGLDTATALVQEMLGS